MWAGANSEPRCRGHCFLARVRRAVSIGTDTESNLPLIFSAQYEIIESVGWTIGFTMFIPLNHIFVARLFNRQFLRQSYCLFVRKTRRMLYFNQPI